MDLRKTIYSICLMFTITFFIASEGLTQPTPEIKAPIITRAWWKATIPAVTETQPRPETKPPIITHAFAVEKGYYGYIWKIYIEAEAGDVNMSRIVMLVDEPGYGRYSNWIPLKPPYRKNLRGYLQWNTFSSSAGYMPEWTQITLKIFIIDKAGNESNEVVFPFTFQSGVKNPYQYKLPTPFDQGDLRRVGYINIDLFPPGGLGYGGRN